MIACGLRIRNIHAAMIGGALAMVLVGSAAASAMAQRLDCVLTDKEASPASENRPVVIVFDEDAKTVTAEEGGQTYSLEKVSISNVSIDGAADSISLGIDRSSFGIASTTASVPRNVAGRVDVAQSSDRLGLAAVGRAQAKPGVADLLIMHHGIVD